MLGPNTHMQLLFSSRWSKRRIIQRMKFKSLHSTSLTIIVWYPCHRPTGLCRCDELHHNNLHAAFFAEMLALPAFAVAICTKCIPNSASALNSAGTSVAVVAAATKQKQQQQSKVSLRSYACRKWCLCKLYESHVSQGCRPCIADRSDQSSRNLMSDSWAHPALCNFVSGAVVCPGQQA